MTPIQLGIWCFGKSFSDYIWELLSQSVQEPDGKRQAGYLGQEFHPLPSEMTYKLARFPPCLWGSTSSPLLPTFHLSWQSRTLPIAKPILFWKGRNQLCPFASPTHRAAGVFSFHSKFSAGFSFFVNSSSGDKLVPVCFSFRFAFLPPNLCLESQPTGQDLYQRAGPNKTSLLPAFLWVALHC